MKNSRWIIPLIISAVVIFSVSCGDDETPAGPGTYPTASILTATTGTSNSVSTSWTMCPDENFSEYSLYRSLTEGISANPPDSPVRVATNAADTTFTNTGLEWNTDYYFAVRTKNTDNLYSWSNEVPVTTPDSGSTGDYLTCYQIQGQQSSSPYENQIISVTGIVTAGGDELYGGYAVLADADGGPWSGLVLYGDSSASLARGDSITISGTVSEYYELTELTFLSDVQVISTGHTLPGVIELTTAQVCEEQYEGVVVSVTDAIVLSQEEYSYEINDGSGSCYMGNRGNYTEPSVGDTVDVQGPLFYEFDQWRIQPRDNNDITINGGGGGGGDVYTCYQIQGQQSSSPFDGQTVGVTGIVVVAGDEYYSSSSAYAVLMDAAGGEWAGLTLFGTDIAYLERGDSITVYGLIDEYFYMTEMKYPFTSIEVHSTGHTLPSPENLNTGDVGQEKWESVLVSVSDVTVTEDDLGFGEWAVNDNSGEIRIDDLGDYTYSPNIGDTFAEIIGVCWYSYDNFKIQPRDDNDIVQ